MINVTNLVFIELNTISSNLATRDRGTDTTHDALPQIIEF